MIRIGTKEGHHEWRVVSHEVQRMRGNLLAFERLTVQPSWTADAACVGVEESFSLPGEMAQTSDPEIIQSLAEMADKFCLNCPIMVRCGEEATKDDAYWTIRGGKLPGVLKLKRNEMRKYR